jgi:hypothetical protein
MDGAPLISFIIPFFNAASTLRRALESIVAQTYAGPLEISCFDDGSTDGSAAVIRAWAAEARPRAVPVTVTSGSDAGAVGPRGPGWARNRAVGASRGAFLCFLDADDEALPRRAEVQLAAARASPGALVGGRFLREPRDATPRYAAWANGMRADELTLHAWRECTLLQPTWFIARADFLAVGGYDETPPALWAAGGAAGGAAEVGQQQHPPLIGRPPSRMSAEDISTHAPFVTFPEDTIFFHRHLAQWAARSTAAGPREGASDAASAAPLVRVDEPVIIYHYSAGSLSWRVPRTTLSAVRAAIFEERLLAPPAGDGLRALSIWGAGRDGKDFYNALSPRGRQRVRAFIDIDANKVGNVYPPPARRKRARADDGDADAAHAPRPLPIRHFRSARPDEARAVVVCVALDAGGEELRANVRAASDALVAAGGDALVEGVNLWFVC